jgi:hypothetical protein
MSKKIDLTGQRFSKWTVVGHANTKNYKVFWLCRCDCGNEVVVNGSNLRSGHSKSCGCWKIERGKLNINKLRPTQMGINHPHWKGGKYFDGRYIRVLAPTHPKSTNGYIHEHTIVMEKMLGRPLANGEVIHHCNGDKSDNRPYNLRLFTSHSEHSKHHAKMRREALLLRYVEVKEVKA